MIGPPDCGGKGHYPSAGSAGTSGKAGSLQGAGGKAGFWRRGKRLTKPPKVGINISLRHRCLTESAVGTYLLKSRRGRIRWRVVDAEGWALGRLAARAARVLMGKSAADFTPHADHRDGVIIVNAAKIRLTGRKLQQKVYRHHTGYPGGLKEIPARHYLENRPDWLVRDAVLGMLPKTRLGDRLARRLKIYAGPTHPHTAQKPEPLALER
jgi:large subunit ribosomal protein L13